MIGQATARVESSWRRHFQSAFGTPYFPSRQKWTAVWPYLSELPSSPLRVLDAGCGSGVWCSELAALRPDWTIVGLDSDADCASQAQELARTLSLDNVTIVHDDFLGYISEQQFDVVISVCSAHYLAEQGKGEELFARFGSWLTSTGRLVLLGPRTVEESSYVGWLSEPAAHRVFCASELVRLCAVGDLRIERLVPVLSAAGAIAHQLAMSPARGIPGRAALFPIQMLLSWVDARHSVPHSKRSAWWFLVARKN